VLQEEYAAGIFSCLVSYEHLLDSSDLSVLNELKQRHALSIKKPLSQNQAKQIDSTKFVITIPTGFVQIGESISMKCTFSLTNLILAVSLISTMDSFTMKISLDSLALLPVMNKFSSTEEKKEIKTLLELLQLNLVLTILAGRSSSQIIDVKFDNLRISIFPDESTEIVVSFVSNCF
jgi:hypothetical protein